MFYVFCLRGVAFVFTFGTEFHASWFDYLAPKEKLLGNYQHGG